MAKGRFRVKAGIDHSTAERLAGELESMGAACSIEDELGQLVRRSTTAGSSRPAMQSGLSAASHNPDESPGRQSLGALERDMGEFALATLDGQDDRPPPGLEAVAAFEPSAFAPPEAVQEDLQLAIDTRQPTVEPVEPASEPDDVAPALGLPAEPPSPPSPPAPARRNPGSALPSSVTGGVAPIAGAGAGPRGLALVKEYVRRGMQTFAAKPRTRFAAGVLLAVLLGFLPAHIFASVREAGAYEQIDAQVLAEQEQVSDLDAWRALDSSRARHLDRKRSAQRSIAMGSLVVWALFGGALGFLWFRRVDWAAYAGE